MGVAYYPQGGSAWSPNVPMTTQPSLTRKERRLQNLRRLAERPGTQAEGEAARAAIERLEKAEDQ